MSLSFGNLKQLIGQPIAAFLIGVMAALILVCYVVIMPPLRNCNVNCHENERKVIQFMVCFQTFER